MLVVNIPGGGGLRAHQDVYTAEPDGFTVGLLANRWVTRPVFGGEEVPDWDVNRIIPLGGVLGGISGIYAIDRNVATSWEELLALPDTPIMGGTAPPSNIPAMHMDRQGIIRVVFGYGGKSEVWGALDRGELQLVNIDSTLAFDLFPEWAPERRLVPVFWEGGTFPVGLLRTMGYDPGEVEVPHYSELPGVDYTRPELEAIDGMVASVTISVGLFLPPDVPEDIVKVWEDAYSAHIQDPEFLQLCRDAFADGCAPMGPEEYRERMNAVKDVSAEGIAIIREHYSAQ